MRQLKRAWELQGPQPKHVMLWAASCICYCGFLRSGEATIATSTAYDPASYLAMSDVALDSNSSLQLITHRIKASKMDPFREGATIYLMKTCRDLCLVAALLGYIANQGPRQGSLFQFPNGTPLTRTALVAAIRQVPASVGIDASHYSGHRFRIRAVTVAAAAGIEDSTIKLLGRWKSAAYQWYTCPDPTRKLRLSPPISLRIPPKERSELLICSRH